jgi:SAM-dependent methyltransferase
VHVQDYFESRLFDLGTTDPKYAGVFAPEAEIGQEKVGVSDFLLSRAEEYFERFQHFGYAWDLLQRSIRNFPSPPSGLALDIGSGFGNTVIPLLQNFPELAIVATDISPDLLGILRRETRKRGLDARCGAVAMDSHGDYFKSGVADVAFGCAVLHHLIDPLKAVTNILKALKPGGRAVFFEPFQAGFVMCRIAYEEILAEARRRDVSGPAFRFLNDLSRDIYVRTHQRMLPDISMEWRQLDDKWLFTRTHFERIAEALNVSQLTIEQIAAPEDLFTRQADISLRQYGGVDPNELPSWAWEILRRFDDEHCSNDLKQELTLEGIVTFIR